MRRRTALTTMAMMPLIACTTQPSVGPTPGPQPGLFVDATYNYGSISPFVRASNTGPWQTLALEHRDLSKQIRLGMVRWPGGNWGDENSVTEWMVDEYIALCRAIGAEPNIHVRLFGGSTTEAAQLVRYTNITKQYGVKYWAIGNEPDLFVKKRGALSYTVADYVDDFVAYRSAMKAVDPSIIVMGPEISQFDANEQYPVDASGEPWLRGFIKRVPDIEMISWHRYPFGLEPVTRDQLRRDPVAWIESVNKTRELLREYVGRDVPIAITEANSDWSGRVDRETGTNSFANALWWSDVMGRLISARCEIIAQFCLGAIPAQGIGMFGPVSYNSGSLPIYHCYQLLARLEGDLIHSSCEDSGLSFVATKSSKGRIVCHLVNQRDAPLSLPLTLQGSTATTAEAWSYSEGSAVSQVASLDLRQSITCPARTAMTIEFG
ncbi:MAG: hypothetical protein FJ040_10885 [Chloroflexi bacterium]|nr:hypothetical protein [Chloroflexota bacterium]